MNDIDYKLIAHYLSGDMSEEARAAFETRMQVEPELRDAVQQYAEAENTPQGEQPLKAPERKPVPLRRYYIAAATVAAIIAIVLFWSPWKQDVYQQFVVQEMTPPAGRDNETATLLQNAAEHFNRQQYRQAIDALNKVIEHHPDDAFAIYYRGLSYLESRQPDYARADLEMIYNGGSVFKYDAAFYIALSYFSAGKKDQCRSWLDKIPAEAGDTYERARRLAGEL